MFHQSGHIDFTPVGKIVTQINMTLCRNGFAVNERL